MPLASDAACTTMGITPDPTPGARRPDWATVIDGFIASRTLTRAPKIRAPDAKLFGGGADDDPVGQPASLPQPTRYASFDVVADVGPSINWFELTMPWFVVSPLPRVPKGTSDVPSESLESVPPSVSVVR